MKICNGVYCSVLLLSVYGAGVNCQCVEGDIRYDPDRLDQLVIQICVDGLWGYTCGYSDVLSTQDVAVACNQMGYISDDNSNVAISLNNSISGVLSLRAIYCTGLENRLIDCPFHGIYTSTGSCKRNGSYHYAAINCTDDPIVCDNNDIRIGDENILELCVYGDWYPLCGEGWDGIDAEIACRTLGQNTKGVKSLQVVNDDISNAYTLRFHCTGDEDSLEDCPRSLISNCDSTLAFLKCGDSIEEPTNIIISSLSSTELSITWAGPIIDYQYDITCVNVNNNESIISYNTVVTNISTVLITGLQASNLYNCCVIAMIDNNISSTPLCDTVLQVIMPSCSIESNSDLEQYSPWFYGFTIGLATGSILVLMLSCCILIVYKTCQQKHNITKTNASISINMNRPEEPYNNPIYSLQTDTPFNNPLYSMSPGDTGPVEKPNQPTILNDYCYIDKRPQVPIPMTEEDTYNTVADGGI